MKLLAPALLALATAALPVHAPVVEDYFGARVADRFRWMENVADPAVQRWVRERDRDAVAQLRGPRNEALRHRIQALDDEGTWVPAVAYAGSRFFVLQAGRRRDVPQLFVRDDRLGPQRLLVRARADRGAHESIDYIAPSPSGRYVAYGVSRGGNENSTLHVMRVADRALLGAAVPNARFAFVSWLPDESGYFYNRLLGPRTLVRSRVYLHRLGSRAPDAPVFGYGVARGVPLAEIDLPRVYASRFSPYVLAVVMHGVQRNLIVYSSPRAALLAGRPRWRRVASGGDGVIAADLFGEGALLLTGRRSSHFEVDRLDLRTAARTTLVPASAPVLAGIAAGPDALYVRDQRGVRSGLRAVDYASGRARTIALPFAGIIQGFNVNPARPGVVFQTASWIHVPLWLRAVARAGAARDLHLKPASALSNRLVEEVVNVRSADGTPVALEIVHLRGQRPGVARPAILEAYGNYGINLDPFFYPDPERRFYTRYAWLERGGIFAFAHPRGGGEFGEDWHRAGMRLNKPRTIADVVACADALVARGYTTHARLIGWGNSAGGITVGNILVSSPRTFGAVIDEVGLSNPVRLEAMANGPANAPEFGTVRTRDGFRSLYAMDPYVHVVDGAPYPPVLLTVGMNDGRLAPWQVLKFAARLREAEAASPTVLLRADYDAGHGMGSTRSQQDRMLADEYTFAARAAAR
ncbi:MAG: prolyl endopeptidase [Candidatus Eremiobacteraeota bacterium]|nr:prolyl endopeptidase [Candidatus Eremiobacteraeota bacterium]